MTPAALYPEILAPAGDEAMLSAAVCSGADAVYLGVSGFNARRGAHNFTAETLPAAVSYCHARGVKVHAALNTLVFADELPALAGAVRAAAEAGVDAVITDDLAAARLVQGIAPGLALHASTQMSIHTAAGARAAAALGFRRVILARELTLEEIRAVAAACPGLELEVFVHGALCFAVSGQCMMSAFLGGRSGNRGACAGPCRLPFDAAQSLRPGAPGTACHLSLKDMDHIPHLPALAGAGVVSVKIEGRLRTPEYVAAAVTAARAAREGRPYDAALLRDIFSRSGFTDGYLTGRRDGAMFGVRTGADAAATRAAAPRARALYRREFARVPVALSVTFAENGVALSAADRDGHTVTVRGDTAPQPAERDPLPGMRAALAKTGGTPFYAAEVRVAGGAPGFVPAAVWNALRRQALETLLAQRAAPRPWPARAFALPAFPARAAGAVPRLAARFESWAQVPPGRTERLAFLVLPIAEAGSVPAPLRAKTILELPRVMFGCEGTVRAQLAACAPLGFMGFAASNLAHLPLAAGAGAGPLYGGLGLNVTNPLAAQAYAGQGLRGLLLHPETPLPAMARVAGVPTAALVYGHLPLMLTRACPLRNVRGCAGCKHAGTLRDRKGRDFALRCAKPQNDVRTLYNPVPLYMGDRPGELPADFALAAFTTEGAERAAKVLALLDAGAPFDSEFTRGVYYKGC